jgi:hypothetical protein
MLNVVTNSSISRSLLSGVPSPVEMKTFSIYLYTDTPSLLSVGTLTIYWNDGVSDKTANFVITPTLLGNFLDAVYVIPDTSTDIDYSFTLVGLATVGIKIGSMPNY